MSRGVFRIFLLAWLLSWLVPAAPAQAEKRVALVIGNAAYIEKALQLDNARRDAEAIAETLYGLGFEVLRGFDLDYARTVAIMRSFAKSLEDAQVAIFYYAGHGVQIGGENYFLPIDNLLRNVDDLNRALPLTRVQTTMEQRLRVNIMFIDACRDNPLAERLAAVPASTRSVTRVRSGLAEVRSGKGTYIVFATDPGDVAFDGSDGHSPFTRALLKHLPTPGLELTKVMQRVQVDVQEATQGKQRPWALSSLTGDFYFINLPQAAAAASDPELAAWKRAIESGQPDMLSVFLRQYPNGRFTAEAKARLAGQELVTSQVGEEIVPVRTLDRMSDAVAKLLATMPPVRRIVTGGFTYGDTRMPTACGRELAQQVGAALGGEVVMAQLAQEVLRPEPEEISVPDKAGPLGLPAEDDIWLLEGSYTPLGSNLDLQFELRSRSKTYTSDVLSITPAYGSPCRSEQMPATTPLTRDRQRNDLAFELASLRGGTPIYTVKDPPEPVQLEMRSSSTAHLYCFERDDTGRIQMLLPNRYRADNQVVPGERLILPDALKPRGKAITWVAEEPGITIIKCFAAERPIRLPPLLADLERSPDPIPGLDDDRLLRIFRSPSAGRIAEASVVMAILPEE